MTTHELLAEIDGHYALPNEELGVAARIAFHRLLDALEDGTVRAAEPDLEGGGWRVNPSVKRGILLGFRLGKNVEFESAGPLQFADKDTYPAQRIAVIERNVRIVPGGSSIRRGSYIGKDVVVMPPAFVNVGAYVDDRTMIDSHALIGSCAQVGKNVHVSAGVQIGGVLEPIGQKPVVIEDGVLLGGNCGIYEGTHIGERAVIGAGCVITASTPVYDLVEGTVYRSTADEPLHIPARAVVIPGSRPAKGDFAREHGLHMAALLIIKYRDERTDARTAFEDLLR